MTSQKTENQKLMKRLDLVFNRKFISSENFYLSNFSFSRGVVF